MKRYYINLDLKRASFETRREKQRQNRFRDDALRECFLNDASRRPNLS